VETADLVRKEVISSWFAFCTKFCIAQCLASQCETGRQPTLQFMRVVTNSATMFKPTNEFAVYFKVHFLWNAYLKGIKLWPGLSDFWWIEDFLGTIRPAVNCILQWTALYISAVTSIWKRKNYTGCPCLYILQEPTFIVVYRMNNICTFYTHLKCGFWVVASRILKKMLDMFTLSFSVGCCISEQWLSYLLQVLNITDFCSINSRV